MEGQAKAAPIADGEALRAATGEALVAETRAHQHVLRGAPDRREASQPQRQRLGELRAARLVVARRLGQQQPRFQIGEPRRHHQVVGGQLQLEVARLLHVGEVLFGEREDRDLGQIDLLRARQAQQQIDRALETLELDDEVGAGDMDTGAVQDGRHRSYDRPVRLRIRPYRPTIGGHSTSTSGLKSIPNRDCAASGSRNSSPIRISRP